MADIVILGGGESGIGAAVLAKLKGYDVFVSDSRNIPDERKSVLLNYGVGWEEGGHTPEKIGNAKEVIKSPGIPDEVEVVRSFRNSNIPVISEIEFGGRYTNAKKICITGSNGKTTTTMLTYHLLKMAGLNVGLAGNVGKSFALSVATEKYDVYVLEISSFQLDGMYDFKAEIAVLLNITPDHMDRYNYCFENYIQSKMRIIRNQQAEDYFIYCQDDEVVSKELEKHELKQNTVPFSIKTPVKYGGYIKDGNLYIKVKANPFIMSIHQLALPGKHNLYNTMASGIVARLLDMRKDLVKECLSDFQNVEHRLESVAVVHGIEFVNDSKATNVNSVWYALDTAKKPVIWIVGGQDKGNDYSNLLEIAADKVKVIICLGKDNSKVVQTFKNVVPRMIETNNMHDAVNQAYKVGKPGDMVLLSPACASFDLFSNFEDRGKQFKMEVRDL